MYLQISYGCCCCYFSYRKMQESSSSHSIPHVALTTDSKSPSISYSASHTTDMSSAQSSNTPQFKKKLLTDKPQSSSTPRDSGSHIAKHQSFDYAKSEYFVIYFRISNPLFSHAHIPHNHPNRRVDISIGIFIILYLSSSRFTHGLISAIW